MATNNSSHTPEQVAYARIESTDGLHHLELRLIQLKDPRHTDWHSYEIRMKNTKDGRNWSLVSTEQHTLFLDKAFDPEVPSICAGLRGTVQSGESFTFSPADEGDFRLRTARDPNGVVLSVQFLDQQAPSEAGWPGGLLVSSEEVLRFANALETAFHAVV